MAAVVALGASCNSSKGLPGESKVGDARPIKIGVMPYLSNAVVEIGVVEGHFAAEGLAAETVLLKGSTEVLSLLVTGELDAGTPALNAAFFNAVAQGSNMRVALPLTEAIVQDCLGAAVIARTDDIEAGLYATPSDWAGARIMASPAGLQGSLGYYLDEALASGGLTRADVRIDKADPPVYEEGLRTGQADMALVLEPWLTRALASEDLGVLLALEPFVPDLQASVIVFSEKFMADEEAAQRFARAYLRAARQYAEGPTARNVEIVSAFTELDADLVRQLCWSYTPTDGRVNVDSIQGFQAWLMAQGLLDAVVPPEAYADLRFAEQAAASLDGDAR